MADEVGGIERRLVPFEDRLGKQQRCFEVFAIPENVVIVDQDGGTLLMARQDASVLGDALKRCAMRALVLSIRAHRDASDAERE
ncbi:hypothetical protein [Longimycelium tulufanense]|nr:hypothetical protein [Longimycelium tulufanense]